jgi:RNA polymerase sigma factor (sigma-70 family)
MIEAENQNGHNPNVEIAAKIFEDYGGFIRTVINYRIKNQALADDVYQDFFLTLCAQQIPEDVKSTEAYLFYFISRYIIDSMRRIIGYQSNLKKYAEYCQFSRRRAEVLLESEVDEVEKMFQTIQKHLSRKEAQAVMLRFQDNEGVKEAAAKMGIKPRSLHRYLAAGLAKLRKSFPTRENLLP